MVVGIDVGTTAVKGVLLGEDARALAVSEHQHDLQSPRPTWAEEDPSEWWEGVVAVLAQLLDGRDAESIGAVGVSGMVPAVIGLDTAGRPVRPSIQQNDARADSEIQWFAERFEEGALFDVSGATWNQQVVAPTLLWLLRNEPDRWSQVVRVTGSYEYITQRLGAEPYTERNWALESGLWDVRSGRWLESILEAAGASVDQLGPVRAAHEIVGVVGREASEATGLAEGTPLIAGSADHIAAAFAAGLRTPGDVVMKFGGAGDFLYVADTFAPVRELFIDYHDYPDAFVINGCMASSGSLVKWFKKNFEPGRSFPELDAMAAGVPAGAEGLIVLPYFLGEKTPLHDPDARGTFVGLTLTHTSAHVHRAILEAVAFAFRHHLEVLEAAGHTVQRVTMMDGGARSPLWRKILASVLDRDVLHLEGGSSGSAIGVGLLAGVSAGRWTWDDVPTFVRVAGTTPPERAWVDRYWRLYGVYRDLYLRLQSLYPELQEALRG